MLIEYSSNALKEADYKEKIEQARRLCEDNGHTFGIQVHNVAETEEIQKFFDLSVPLSFHAPVSAKHFPNFAAVNCEDAFESMAVNAEIMRKYGATLAVFHGFLMTDKPIPAFRKIPRGSVPGEFASRGSGNSYTLTVGQACRGELSYGDCGICKDFLDTEEYQTRLERVNCNFKKLRDLYPDHTLCIENDFPIFGAGMLTAERILQTDGPLCLDTSHLWTSSLLFKNDYLEEVRTLAETGRIKCVHLHASPLPADAEIEDYKDGHKPLGTPTPTGMDLRKTVKILKENSVDHFTLEIPTGSIDDFKVLIGWLR